MPRSFLDIIAGASRGDAPLIVPDYAVAALQAGVWPFGTGTSLNVNGVVAVGDGTSGAPSMAFTSEPTLGFWRSAAGTVKLQGSFAATGSIVGVGVNSTTLFTGNATGTSLNLNVANGVAVLQNNGATIGSQLKVDALPTIASGFGTSPAVIAGSTPFAGAVDVGTGAAATTGVITFGGTAFPSAPFVTVTCSLGAVPTIATTTTTQLTLTTSVAWPANTRVNWQCISSK